MNNDEILLIQNYLRDLFDNEDISVRKEQDIPPSASLYVFSESIGSIQKDDDPDEEDISYSLTIPIDIPISDSQGLESNIQSISKKKKIIISAFQDLEGTLDI